MADFVKLEQKHKVLDARFEVSGVDWKTSVLMSFDHHYDSVDCDRKMVKRHFDICKENDLPILIFGDFFDAMRNKSISVPVRVHLTPNFFGQAISMRW